MYKYIFMATAFLLIAGCGGQKMTYWQRIDLGGKYTDSHILSVNVKGDEILIGTFGKGALFSKNDGKTWQEFEMNDKEDNSGLSWNYVLGGVWDGDYIVLATLGDGLNISNDGGQTWKRLGYNFFGIEYLYAVGACMSGKTKYIPTADGIVYFESDLRPDIQYIQRPYKTIDETQGLASQYIYDMQIDGDNIYVGSLHGFSVSNDKGQSWENCSPTGEYTKGQLPYCKIRAVAVHKKTWYAGGDNGLFYSDDNGESWVNISKGLPSLYVHDILVDNQGRLWIATYKGVAFSDNKGKSYTVYGKTSGFYGENINCLAETSDGNIYAGTNYGLYTMTDQIPPLNAYPEPTAVFEMPEKPIHQWMIRPVSPEENNQRDQTYLYGATMGGNFRQHQGCEYNDPEGVALMAVDDGVIVYTNEEIGHTVLRCDTRLEKYYVYAHYHHMHAISRHVGDTVRRGEAIGTIGKKGNVTNEHLHFEVSLSEANDSNVPNKTVNNELWQKPLPDCGTIVGKIVDSAGNPIPGARIYGVEKPVPTESPFSFAESYRDQVNPSPAYNENFVIADVPASDYFLWVEDSGQKFAVKAKVAAGMVTQVRLVDKLYKPVMPDTTDSENQ